MTMLGEAKVMPGLGPVPLLQRKSAAESRWTRTVPTSRESARKIFPKGPFLHLTKMEGARRHRRASLHHVLHAARQRRRARGLLRELRLELQVPA